MNSERLASRLRFRDIRLLVALADGSSLRKAAETLNVTQPALSRALNDIEDTFGCAFFERSTRGLRPTAQGVIAMRGARQLLNELERVDEEIADSKYHASVVRVGAPPFVAHGVLPDLMARMHEAGCRVRFRLIEGAVNDLFDYLVRGEVDALITTYTNRVIKNAKLTYESLFPSRYRLIAAPRLLSRQVAKKEPSLVDLAGLPWVMPGHTSMLRKDIDRAFLAAGIEPPNPIVECNHPFTVLHFVASGCGIGFVPNETLQAIRPGLVGEIALTPPLSTGSVTLIHLAKSQNSPQLQLVREFIGRTRPTRLR